MKCVCGARARCVNSRPTPEGTVNRRYHCVCGERFSSVELVVRETEDGLILPPVTTTHKRNTYRLLRRALLLDVLRKELEQ